MSDRRTYWSSTSLPPTYQAVRSLAISFSTYKKSEKREWVVERQELSDLFSNIQNKLKTYKMAPYAPPEGLEVEVLDRAWGVLLGAEEVWSKSINSQIRESVKGCFMLPSVAAIPLPSDTSIFTTGSKTTSCVKRQTSPRISTFVCATSNGNWPL